MSVVRQIICILVRPLPEFHHENPKNSLGKSPGSRLRGKLDDNTGTGPCCSGISAW